MCQPALPPTPLRPISGLAEVFWLVCAWKRGEGFPKQGLRLPTVRSPSGGGYVGWPLSVELVCWKQIQRVEGRAEKLR